MQRRVLGGDRGRVEPGHLEQRRGDVDRRHQRARSGAAGDVGVTNDERNVEVFVVDEVALLTKPVRAHAPPYARRCTANRAEEYVVVGSVRRDALSLRSRVRNILSPARCI
jgi:hypothetical protein